MEKKDKESCQDLEDHHDAAGSAEAPPAGSGRILVKLKIHKTPDEAAVEVEEGEVVEAAEIPPPANDQETKSHYCKECNKSFRNGKALGGHMSSAHVQANKDYSYSKKLNKMKRLNKGSASSLAADNTCRECGKTFRSKKSLFGHMRCHPEREWRGMEPPQKVDSLMEASSEPEFDDFEANQDSDGDDSGPDEATPAADVSSNLKGWPTAAKRGRRLMNPFDPSPVSSSEEKETFVAGHQLIRLLKGDSMAESDGGDRIKKLKMDNSGVEKLKIHENEANKGNNTKPPETLASSDDIDSDDERYITAIEVLANGKRDKLDNQKPVMAEKSAPKGDSVKSSPEKYICNKCNRSFATHQALGGHRSSHNKMKLSIINTADRRAKTVQKREKEKSTSKFGDDNSLENADKVGLGFDLNVAPMEEDKDDVDGEPSNGVSNS